ncbi:MAG: hypothetical protein RLZ10_2156 [Bacteroidota bacterium]|jgi:hypothetical protein
MFLLNTGTGAEFEAGQSPKGIWDTMGSQIKDAFEYTIKQAQGIEQAALKVQKEALNIAIPQADAIAYKNKLTEVFKETQSIGAQFKDITELSSAFNNAIESAILPSQQVTKNMVEFSKSTGIANADVGKMFGDFSKFLMSQTRAQEVMQKITKTARLAGQDTKGVIDDVTTNMTKINTLGFSNGVEGLTKMAVQAKLLKTNIESIGSLKLAETLWDPKKAVELASKMQMFGGEVGKLGDSFQVYRMGAMDVEELNEAMLDVTATAFKFNEQTGQYEASFVGKQRLKDQAAAMDMSFDQAAKIGKERAKQLDIEKKLMENAQIASKISSGTLTKEQFDLIKSMTEFSKDATGKFVMNLDIPGFSKIDNLENTLKDAGKTNQLLADLEKYKKETEKSDRDIAKENLSVNEQNEINTRLLREYMYLSLDMQKREEALKIAKDVGESAKSMYGIAQTNVILPAVAAKVGAGAAALGPYSGAGTYISDASIQAQKPGYDFFYGGDDDKIIYDAKGQFKTRLVGGDDIIAFPDAGQFVSSLADYYKDSVKTFDNLKKMIGGAISTQVPKIDFTKFEENLKNKVESFNKSISSQSTKEEKIINENTNVGGKVEIEVSLKGMTPSMEEIFKNPNVKSLFVDMITDKLSKQRKDKFKTGIIGSSRSK